MKRKEKTSHHRNIIINWVCCLVFLSLYISLFAGGDRWHMSYDDRWQMIWQVSGIPKQMQYHTTTTTTITVRTILLPTTIYYLLMCFWLACCIISLLLLLLLYTYIYIISLSISRSFVYSRIFAQTCKCK